MADNGMIGNGIMVGYRITGSPGAAHTLIGQLLNVDGLELARAAVDRTVHSANDFERDLPGMIRMSPLHLELLASPDELVGEGVVQEALIDLLLAGTTVEWRIEVPVDRAKTKYKGYVFDGFVRTWKHGKPIKERQVYEFEINFDDDSFDIEAAAVSAF